MIIRMASTGDAQGIATVHVQSWQETYRSMIPDDLLDNLSIEQRKTMWETVINEQLDKNPVFVAEDNGAIVAFASAGISRDEFEEYDSELYAIYALKAIQGKGIGRQLMKQIAQALQALGYKALMLWVVQGNPTENFYAHLGGKPLSERTEVFSGTEVTEIAYGWTDIRILLARKGD